MLAAQVVLMGGSSVAVVDRDDKPSEELMQDVDEIEAALRAGREVWIATGVLGYVWDRFRAQAGPVQEA